MAAIGAGTLLTAAVPARGQALPAKLGAGQAEPGEILAVGLFSELASPQVPPDVHLLLSSGYRLAGKGIALYADSGEQTELSSAGRSRYEAAAAAEPGRAAAAMAALLALERRWRVQAADGRWFTLVSEHESDMFGTVGDGFHLHNRPGPQPSQVGGTVVTADCQAYLDYCTYFVGEPCRWSAGNHLVDDVLHAGYGESFHQTIMEGAGPHYFGESGFAGTSFMSTRRDRPVFSFAGQRYAAMRDIFVVGHFVSHRRAANLAEGNVWTGPSAASNGRHDIEPEAWIDPANPPSADSRYAPYAAVAVDAYAGSRPDQAYPTPAYPAWIPLRPWGGARLTSAVEFDRVGIAGFVVGVMVNPSNEPAQGDFVQFHRGAITDCKWAVSVGNHQSRNVAVRDSRIAGCWTAFTNNRHGAQAGMFGGTIDNVSFGEIINVIDFNTYAGTVQFLACYGEVIWSLGWYTGANGFTAGASFSRCTWNLSHPNEARGRPPAIYSDRINPGNGGYGTVDFPETSLIVQSVAVVQKDLGSGAILIQPQERLGTISEPGQEWRRQAANAMHAGLATAGFAARGRDIRVESFLFDLDSGALLQKQHDGSLAPRSICSSHYVSALGTEAPGDLVPRPQLPHVLDKSRIVRGSVVQRGREIELALAGTLSPYEHGTLLGIGPGGVWMDVISGTILWCKAADYGRRLLTLELQNNFRRIGGATSLVQPIDWYRSGEEIRIVHGRYFTPLWPLTGDFEAGRRTVANVRTAAGGGAADAGIRAGDGLFLRTESGLAHAGRVEAFEIDAAGRGRIELNAPAAESATGRRLALFVRAQAPNGTAG